MARHLARLGRVFGLCMSLLAMASAAARAEAIDPTPSDARDADALFEQGVELTRAGQFDAALSRFLAAQDRGDASARLQFNLGVVYYRLQRWTQARSAFTNAATEPEMADLARYNLGLVALAAGERSVAADWFRRTARSADEAALRALANRALSSMGEQAEARTGAGSLALLRAHDSNVVIPVGTVSDRPSSIDDQLLELRAGWADSLYAWAPGLDYRLGGVWLRHDRMDAANIGLAEGSLGWRGSIQLEGGLGLLAVGDRPYQRTLDARASWPVPLDSQWYRMSLESSLSRLDALGSRARDLDGWQFGVGSRLEIFFLPALSVNLSYRHIGDDRRAAALSPDQDLVLLKARYVFDRWILRTWGRYSHRQFPTPRRDESREWGGEITYRMFENWDVMVEASRLDNQSSDSGFAFVSNRVYAGLRWRY